MKKIVLFSMGLLVFLLCVSPVGAVNANQELRKAEREEIRSEAKNKIGTISTQPKENIFKNIWANLTKKFPNLLPAGINRATIVSFSQKTLLSEITVDFNGQTIVLRIDENTSILRKFGGKSSLTEMNIGDLVSARGEWQDSDRAIFKTRVLRDLSIQKRKDLFG